MRQVHPNSKIEHAMESVNLGSSADYIIVCDKKALPSIYFSAALFCPRELIVNVEINKRLEDIGYKSCFPQRDKIEEVLFAKYLKESYPNDV